MKRIIKWLTASTLAFGIFAGTAGVADAATISHPRPAGLTWISAEQPGQVSPSGVTWIRS
jgi:hypothetical protein